ncbi:MAG: ABC transporter permease subunit [bacterium]
MPAPDRRLQPADVLGVALLVVLLLPVVALLATTSAAELRAGLAHPRRAGPGPQRAHHRRQPGRRARPRHPLAWRLAARPAPGLVEILVSLPVVIPPAVLGVALLATFGQQGLLGGSGLPFTEAAVIVAQVVVAAPFYVQGAAAAFRKVDADLLLVARTLGAGRARTFFGVALPAALPGLLAGAALAWARALGEFGATLLFAGNLSGRTQTMPSRSTRPWRPTSGSPVPSRPPRRGGRRRPGARVVAAPAHRAVAMIWDLQVKARVGPLDLDLRLQSDVPVLLVIGPNGAGKTSLLRLIAGVRPLDAGHLRVAGRDLAPAPPEARRIGYVPQNASLFPHLTALGNVAFGLHALPRTARAARALALLAAVDAAHLADRLPARSRAASSSASPSPAPSAPSRRPCSSTSPSPPSTSRAGGRCASTSPTGWPATAARP